MKKKIILIKEIDEKSFLIINYYQIYIILKWAKKNGSYNTK